MDDLRSLLLIQFDRCGRWDSDVAPSNTVLCEVEDDPPFDQEWYSKDHVIVVQVNYVEVVLIYIVGKGDIDMYSKVYH